MPVLVQAHVEPYLATLRKLFLDYADALGFDLAFQDFQQEIAGLPGEYRPPSGRAYVAFEGDVPVGCIALRGLDPGICEMKRMYVCPAFRGRHIGRLLATHIVQEARQIGYKAMRLDTVPWMTEAITLYLSLGFREIQPYRFNPIEGARFFELEL
ncbi:MAG: GNAT family N-acetyltransferase [Phycisphaerales bacterium]|nr:MAG: GNAT family N-acetyltransferase [Phycisphaerales bacterium]